MPTSFCTATAKASDLKAHGKQLLYEKIAHSVLALITAVAFAPVIAILIYIVVKGGPALTPEFLTSMPTQGMKAGGIFPAIVGTFYLVLGTIIFSVPVGTLAAVYLTEYATQGRLTRAIRLAIANMADRKSVV